MPIMPESGRQQKTPDDQGSEVIWGMKQKIAKLQINIIIGNPGFPGINQNILFCLDHDSQMVFRQVCQSWSEQVDNPFFWIKKLKLKRNSRKVGDIWIDLVRSVQKGSYLEKEVIQCLMKWYGKNHSYSESILKRM